MIKNNFFIAIGFSQRIKAITKAVFSHIRHLYKPACYIKSYFPAFLMQVQPYHTIFFYV